jgi:ATP-binding cassette subfamily F protein uup
MEALPGKIETLEAEQTALTGKLAEPIFFKTAEPEVGVATKRLEKIEEELTAVYARWTELEG